MKERLIKLGIAGATITLTAILFVGLLQVILASRSSHELLTYEAKMTHFVAECVQYGNSPDRCALIFGMGGN